MSLDVARRQMALQGPALLSQAIHLAAQARQRLNEIPGIYCFGADRLADSPHSLDPTRLTVTVSGLGVFGYEADDWLNARYDVQPETSTLHNVIFVVTLGNTQRDIDRLIEAFQAMAQLQRRESLEARLNQLAQLRFPQAPPQRLTPRTAFFAEIERLPLSETVGRICGEIISPYPPGIPILIPGEEVTQRALDYVVLVHRAGGFINGPEDVRLETLKVVKE